MSYETKLISDSELNETCQKIFNDLKQALGLAKNHLPFMEIVDNLPNPRFSMAMANSDTKMIYLEKQTAQLAIRMMGDDAKNGIAYILAHELAHVMRHHNSTNKFISRFQKGFLESQSSASGMAANSTEVENFIVGSQEQEFNHNIRMNEAEADLDAGFTAFLAGYNTKVAGPAFLQTVYDDLKLNPTPNNYASLDERKLILRLTGERLDTLIHVFEMGNYLSAAGEYSAANDCYFYVSKEVQSPALLNNLGVTSLLEVTGMMKVQDIKYVLPITLDFGNNGSRGVNLEARKKAYAKKIFLLEDAIMNFEKAASLNEDYYQAHINKSVAHYLKFVVQNKERTFSKFIFDDLNFGLSSALKAKQIIINNEAMSNKSLADAYTQIAIIYKELGMLNQSTRFINKALEEFPTSFVAQSNQSILKKQGEVATLLVSQGQSPFKKCRDKETVNGGSTLDDMIFEAFDNGLWTLEADIKSKKGKYLETITTMRFYETDTYNLYNIAQTVGSVKNKTDLSFYVPKRGQTETSACGINSQSNMSDLKENYGTESKSIETVNSSLLRFIDESVRSNGVNYYDGILFVIDGLQSVDRWVAFQIAKIEE